MKRLRPAALLLLVSVLAYGLLIPKLGFYWDDLPISWIRYQLGPDALTRYFSTNRPVFGLVYQVFTRILPQQPLPWQVLALFWRWMTGLLVWAVMRRIWPQRKRTALAVSLLFLVYPGFNQQSVSFVYGYHFLTLSVYLFSLLCMLWALKRPRAARALTLLGMLFAAGNLVMGEYFFFLDVLRPFILWVALRDIAGRKERLRRVAWAWLPYLIIFLAAVAGRMFFFNNQTYEYNLLAEFSAQPLDTVLYLLKTILLSLWTVTAAAWGQAFSPPDFTLQGTRTILVYVGVVVLVLAAALVALFKTRDEEDAARRNDVLWTIVLGLLACLMAGWPFWLIDLPVSLGFPGNRFTLPFMLGSALMLAGLLALVPRPNLRVILLALLIALSAGRQFLWTDEYRRDWNVQKSLFWQMSWRIPALQPNTLLLLNEGALKFYADNSLSAPLNWIYAPENRSRRIYYMLFYPGTRLGGSLPALEGNQPVSHDFLAGEFHGNTSQAVALYFSPPGCLHVLDPEIDPGNRLISDLLIRDAASLSRPDLILTQGLPRMPEIYAPEPPHRWCYYFERADLARQQGDWEQVVELGDQAFALDDYPNDPGERFVFIEGYAHVGDWGQAQELSVQSYRVSPDYVAPVLCRLWERIDASTQDSVEKQASVAEMRAKFTCSP